MVDAPPASPAARRQQAERFGQRMLDFATMLMLPTRRDAERFAELMQDLALDYAAGPVTEEAHNEQVSEAVEMLPITKTAAIRFAANTRRELLRILGEAPTPPRPAAT